MQDMGVSDFSMPMIAGAIFFVPLLVSVWVLQKTPPPDVEDRQLRSERKAMTREDRRRFLYAFWPGITLLIFVYITLTIARTIRDDFAVEIWRDMGVSKTPSVFATSETWVGIVATTCLALTMLVKNNLMAMRVTFVMMCIAFVLVAISAWAIGLGAFSPFVFMVMCGIGLYIPYVAFHTSVFERLIAAARMPSNLGFLMYMADSIGYLGYAVVIVAKTRMKKDVELLPYFQWILLLSAFASILCLMAALLYFQRALAPTVPDVPTSEELAHRLEQSV
jgi:MFS family permease